MRVPLEASERAVANFSAHDCVFFVIPLAWDVRKRLLMDWVEEKRKLPRTSSMAMELIYALKMLQMDTGSRGIKIMIGA